MTLVHDKFVTILVNGYIRTLYVPGYLQYSRYRVEDSSRCLFNTVGLFRDGILKFIEGTLDIDRFYRVV